MKNVYRKYFVDKKNTNREEFEKFYLFYFIFLQKIEVSI
jgi:hypothetical protein